MLCNMMRLLFVGNELTNEPKTNRRLRQRRGIAMIWTVLVMMLTIAIVGLVLDIGLGFLAGHQLQNAADAAALAGAQKLGSELAVIQNASLRVGDANYAAAQAVQLSLNPSNALSGDIVIGTYNRLTGTFITNLESPNAVMVNARRTSESAGGPLGLVFSPIFGLNNINVERAAIAMRGGDTGSGLIVLDNYDDATFRISGDVTLDVRDVTADDGMGAIQVNSNSFKALKTDGNPALIAGEINAHATYVNDPPEFDGDVNTGQSRVSDPLANLPPPADRSPIYLSTSFNNGVHNLQPGYYPDGISMTGGTVNLAAGVYVLDGVGLNVTGGNLIGEGVLLYVIDSPGKPASSINLVGNGAIDLTPAPLNESLYGGLVLWQDAANTNDANIVGTDQFAGIDGTVYIPSGFLDLGGTSDSFGISQLIVNSIRVHGTGTINVNYDGRFPAVGTDVFLVK